MSEVFKQCRHVNDHYKSYEDMRDSPPLLISYVNGGVHLSRRKDTISINKYGFGKLLHTRM